MAKAERDTIFLGKFYPAGEELPKEYAEMSKPKAGRRAANPTDQVVGAEAYKPGFSGSGVPQTVDIVTDQGKLRSTSIKQGGRQGPMNEEGSRAEQKKLGDLVKESEAAAMQEIADVEDENRKLERKSQDAATKKVEAAQEKQVRAANKASGEK